MIHPKFLGGDAETLACVNQFLDYIRLSKLKPGTSSFGGNKNEQKIIGIYFETKNCLCLSLKLPSPDQYLFHCSIQNNTGGDETTFAFAVTHHQNSSQG